jgi:hypothetical protein
MKGKVGIDSYQKFLFWETMKELIIILLIFEKSSIKWSANFFSQGTRCIWSQ